MKNIPMTRGYGHLLRNSKKIPPYIKLPEPQNSNSNNRHIFKTKDIYELNVRTISMITILLACEYQTI